MSDLVKWMIGLMLWLILTIGSYNFSKTSICASLPFFKHNHLEKAISNASETAIVSAENKDRFPIDFRKSDPTPFRNEGFEEYQTKILGQATSDNILKITGLYIEGEINSSTYANLGLARANEVKKLFATDFPADRIRVFAKKASSKGNTNLSFFEAISFNWITESKSTVEVFSDRTVIRFAFNSVEKEVDITIDNYLEKLAKRVIETKEKVSLTGHTDNIGDAEVNVNLGLRRAKMIRDNLIKKGVNRNLINTYSKGENEPLADNTTENGRQKNRRVVVRLIKK